MKHIFSILLMLSTFYSFTQDYRVVHDKLPAIYESNPYWQVRKYNVLDTVSVVPLGTDSLYFTFLSIRDTGDQGWGVCLDAEAGSIMGRKLLHQPARTILFNRYGDSIIIVRNTKPGDVWNLYTYPNGDKAEALHESTEIENVLGTTDSVKLFRLTRKDTLGTVVDDELNGKEITLSRNFGLIKTFDTYLFPEILEEQYLMGFEGAGYGMRNLTAREVFDFEPGDEFHFQYEDTFSAYDEKDSVVKIISGDIGEMIRTVLNRVDYQDSVSYHYWECRKVKRYANGEWSTLYLSDTVEETITYDSIAPGILEGYPGMKIESAHGTTYHKIDYSKMVWFDGLPVKIITYDAYMDYDTCVVYSLFDPCCYSELYIQSCGGPYFTWSDMFGSIDKNELVYFRKHDAEWGEPVAENCEDLLSGLDEEVARPVDLRVFPNPFSAMLNIECRDCSSVSVLGVEMVDLNGKVVKTATSTSPGLLLKTNGITPGFYLLRIIMDDGTTLRRKVVKVPN